MKWHREFFRKESFPREFYLIHKTRKVCKMIDEHKHKLGEMEKWALLSICIPITRGAN